MTVQGLDGGLPRWATRTGGPLRLNARARRPGIAHEELTLPLDEFTRRAVRQGAARDRLPAALWVVLVGESTRALSRLAEISSATVSEIAQALDARAARPPATPRDDRLAAWACALRDAQAAPELADRALTLLVPYHSAIAWHAHARTLESSVAGWLRPALMAAGPARHLWEAAAAERGQTMAEWCAAEALGALTGC